MATPHISGAVALICSRYYKRFKKYPSGEMITTLLQYQSIDLGKVGFDELYGYGMFSFNPDGGKAIVIEAGEKYCKVNNKNYELPAPPSSAKQQMNGSLNALADLLGSDAQFVPAGFENNEKDILQVWC
jgi:hypothetical protein